MDLKKSVVSVDNLTVLGFKVQEKFNQLLQNEFDTTILKRYRASFPFDWTYQLLDKVTIQESISNDKRNFRLEFNPNKINSSNHFIERYIGCMKYAKLSRVDVAIDIYDIDINEFYLIDELSRKQNIWYSGTGEIETIYIGSPSSDLRIRIYNKAKEQDIPDEKWWRIEAQIRGDFLKDCNYKKMNLPDVFDSLIFVRRSDELSKVDDIRERAMLHYLMTNEDELSRLNKRTRLKYKKRLSELGADSRLPLSDIFKLHKYTIQKQLKKYIEPTLINNKISRVYTQFD